MKLKDFKNKPGVFLQEGHEYVTRRQLLSAGVIPFAASMVMPTLWDIFMRNGIAEAQSAFTCTPISAGASPFPAILHINLAGGPAAAQYAVPVGPDNATPLTNAGQLGLGTNSATYNQVKMFGNNILVPQSNGQSADPTLGAFFNAVSSNLSAATLANTSVVCNAVSSANDTSNDNEDPSGLISKWATGTKLPRLILNSSNVNQQPALITPPTAINVQSVTSVGNQLAPATGALNATLSSKQKQDVFNLAASLSGSQATTLGSMPNGQNFTQLMNCAGIQNVQLAQQGATSFDPRTDTIMQGIYGINAGSSPTSAAVIEATIVNCALLGLTPIAQISMGGYDYHGNPRTVTDAKDTAAGQVMNRAIQAAAAKKVPLYIIHTQDGSTQASSQTAAGAPSAGDYDQGSMNSLTVYNPKGPVAASRNWINGYTTNQGANPASYSSNDIGSITTLVANIMHNFTGANTAFNTITTGITGAPTAAQLTSVVVI